MGRVWQVQEAKNCFSELVDEAIAHGPQVITRRGKETAVLLSYDEFRKLSAPPMKLSEFFRNSLMAEADLEITRDTSSQRAGIDL